MIHCPSAFMRFFDQIMTGDKCLIFYAYLLYTHLFSVFDLVDETQYPTSWADPILEEVSS